MNVKNVYIFIISIHLKKKIMNIYKKNYNSDSHDDLEKNLRKLEASKNLIPQIIRE